MERKNKGRESSGASGRPGIKAACLLETRLQAAACDQELFQELVGKKVIIKDKDTSFVTGELARNGRDFIELKDACVLPEWYDSFKKAHSSRTGMEPQMEADRFDSLVMNKSDIHKIAAEESIRDKP